MNITLPYIDEKSGSGARAAREGSAFIISCVSDAPFTNYHVNRGDARFIGSMVSSASRLEATRVASFPISFERIEGEGEEGDAEEYWMDNAGVKVSRRGNYFFRLLFKPVSDG